MAKPVELITVACPCCEAKLHIDPETKAVIRFEEHIRPPSIADFETAVNLHKNEAGRREDAFKKSVDAVEKPLDEAKKVRFEKALATLMMHDVMMAQGVVDEASGTKKLKETFDGKTAEQVIAEGEKLQAANKAEIEKMVH